MPDLLDRMLGYLDEDQSELAVSPEVIISAMFDFDRGILDQAQIRTNLALTRADWDALTVVYAAIFVGGTLDVEEFRNLMAFGSTRNRSDPTGAAYYPKSKVKTRLGL